MKKLYRLTGILAALAIFASCQDYLDITPKGMTTLDNIDDLGYLLNQEYSIGKPTHEDLARICGESISSNKSVSNLLQTKNSLDYAYAAYDESVDRAALSVSDTRYERLYKYINYMNVVVNKVSALNGNDAQRAEDIAKAKVLRAYFHFVLVNIYAKQYDAATAANEGGIAYVDDVDASTKKVKLSLQQVYDKILEDCTEDIIANLPDESNADPCNVGKAFGNAVRAKALFQMKRYSDALPFALEAINLKGNIKDYSTLSKTRSLSRQGMDKSNIFYLYGGAKANFGNIILTKETTAILNSMPNHFIKKYTTTWNATNGPKKSGVSGTVVSPGFSSYYSNSYGINVETMYYVAAECYIRTGKIKEGLQFVDKVRTCRIEGATPYSTQQLSVAEAMDVLRENKWIECIGMYDNFIDCKRWNSEPEYKRDITHNFDAAGTYTIKPDSKLWVIPFPASATLYNDSLTQNY